MYRKTISDGRWVAAVAPAMLLAPAHVGAAIGVASFWLTVTMAVAGSALSAFCVAAPVSEPKRDPYSFIGQWFVWLATPLLWGVVAASLVFIWLKPLDLLAVLLVLGMCRWGAQAVCNLKWRKAVPVDFPFTVSARRRVRLHE